MPQIRFLIRPFPFRLMFPNQFVAITAVALTSWVRTEPWRMQRPSFMQQPQFVILITATLSSTAPAFSHKHQYGLISIRYILLLCKYFRNMGLCKNVPWGQDHILKFYKDKQGETIMCASLFIWQFLWTRKLRCNGY